MRPFLLGFFDWQNQLFCIVGRNFISGRWVELVLWGLYKRLHDVLYCCPGDALPTLVIVRYLRVRELRDPYIEDCALPSSSL